jgi:cytoskeletal protein CcmA (bactofilin family)
MVASKRVVLADFLTIEGNVSAPGTIEINGLMDGEVHCRHLLITSRAKITGSIQADSVVVEGTVEGSIFAGLVVLKATAHIVGDVTCGSVSVEKGAYLNGRLTRSSQWEALAAQGEVGATL